MANRAYLRVWTRDFSNQTMIAEFARFLTTAPISEGEGGFQQLTVQAVDATETAVAEWDLREGTIGPAEIAALAAQHLNDDTAFIVEAEWDLWSFDMETLKWTQGRQPLEHLFTGHGGLLVPSAEKNPLESSDHSVEKTFRNWMASTENLKQYHQKTQENIQKLFRWVEAVEAALPVERSELWSEGEENFEARLDAILAQR